MLFSRFFTHGRIGLIQGSHAQQAELLTITPYQAQDTGLRSNVNVLKDHLSRPTPQTEALPSAPPALAWSNSLTLCYPLTPTGHRESLAPTCCLPSLSPWEEELRPFPQFSVGNSTGGMWEEQKRQKERRNSQTDITHWMMMASRAHPPRTVQPSGSWEN